MSGAEGGPGKRAGHKASTAPRSDPYFTARSVVAVAVKLAAADPGIAGVGGSSRDKVGSVQDCRMGRAR